MNMRLVLAIGVIIMLSGCSREPETKTDLPKVIATELPVEFTRGYGSFSLIVNDDAGRNIMTFSNKDSLNQYHQLKLTVSKDTMITLESELVIFDAIWQAAEDSLDVHLDYIFVGYPLEYDDILKNQIEAFIQDSTWHAIKDEAALDFMKIRSVMKEQSVYAPLSDWLQTKGYKISRFLTEKHGFIQSEDLIRLGYSGNEAIPVPFMVWIEVANTNQITSEEVL